MKYLKYILIISIITIIGIVWEGCEKSDSVNTTYVIEPFAQIRVKIPDSKDKEEEDKEKDKDKEEKKKEDKYKDSIYHNATDVSVFLFYIDDSDTLYKPDSYKHALEGKIRRITDKEELIADFALHGPKNEKDTTLFFESVTKKKFVLVACDTTLKIYGYRGASTLPGLSRVWIPATFRSGLKNKEDKYQNWTFINEFITEDPKDKPEENPDKKE